MYKTIYIPVDNSDHSNTAVDVGVELAKPMARRSWVAMSTRRRCTISDLSRWAGLPEEYHDEKELDRQRQIHDSLITADYRSSRIHYLGPSTRNVMRPTCRWNVAPRRTQLEKCWLGISIRTYDLVIMGRVGSRSRQRQCHRQAILSESSVACGTPTC